MDLEEKSLKIGEVLQASTDSFTAQCYELHNPPPLGSLVKAREGEVEVYGVVGRATTQGVDPGRRPLALGEEEAEEEDIYRHHPQLAKLFCTSFEALVVGHRERESLHHYLPPRPARVHSFVYLCLPGEVRGFTSSLDFLHLLVQAQLPGLGDEVIAACLRWASRTQEDSQAFLTGAGKEMAQLFGAEPNRLRGILRRIAP